LIDHEDTRQLEGPEVASLAEFRLEGGLPVWRFEAPGLVLERRIFFSHRRNMAHVLFKAVESAPGAILRLQPALGVRPHEGMLAITRSSTPDVTLLSDGFEMTFSPELAPLRGLVHGQIDQMSLSGTQESHIEYSVEQARGYDHQGSLVLAGHIDLP